MVCLGAKAGSINYGEYTRSGNCPCRCRAVGNTGSGKGNPVTMNTSRKLFDVLVVGAGFAGSVMAQRLASAGLHVLLIDRRGHIGGNAFDELDGHGVLIHRYGPHIFHTNAARIVDYLSQFTEWLPYEHHVLAQVEGQLLPIPINRLTVNRLYGLNLDEAGVQAFLERVREPRNPIRTSEDVVLNAVGRDLYEKFFQGYTRKHWGLDPAELNASVAARIPVRCNDDCRYFTDTFQIMPKHGYTALFKRMLDHPNIQIELGVDFFGMRFKVMPQAQDPHPNPNAIDTAVHTGMEQIPPTPPFQRGVGEIDCGNDEENLDSSALTPNPSFAKEGIGAMGDFNRTHFLTDEVRHLARHVVYTGPIDAYFNYCYGKLPYRSLRFEHEHLVDKPLFQSVGTVNYPNDHAFTRITEFKHLTAQTHTGTSIVREFPQNQGEPYYPVPRPENESLFQRYKALAANEENTSFVGRLAQYRYYNMDQVVAAALKAADDLLEKLKVN